VTDRLSVYLQLQKVARDRKRPVEEIFTLYGLERFLARLADTSYAEDFCLKGGLLLSAHALRRRLVICRRLISGSTPSMSAK